MAMPRGRSTNCGVERQGFVEADARCARVSARLGQGLVKAVMRAAIVLQRQSEKHIIASSESDGIGRLLTRASVRTPSREVVESDLAALRKAVPGQIERRASE